MLPQATYSRLRLIAALSLLAMLLAVVPTQAHAADAVICNANPAGMHRALLAQASESHQAGLVIDFGDGRVMTFCIDLGADGQATGEELLRASNLPVIFEYSGGIGSAVCKIDNVGSDFPAESCFSHCTLQPGETCLYWSYSQLVGDHWQFSQVGASGTIVHSGDVNGWAWGESTITRGAQPPLRTLADICLPATATPTASLTPTPTVTPTATLPPAAPPPATTTPYVARIITATPTVSATPTSTPTASPVVAPAAPTASTPFEPAAPLSRVEGQGNSSGQASAPAQASAPTALPAPSPTAAPPPTTPPSATPLPLPTSSAPADTSDATLPTSAPANRSAGGSLRIQLPLIQHAAAATTSATTRPTAQVAALATLPIAPPAPVITRPAPARQDALDDHPTRNYPYFGGTAVFLLAGWAMLRRGRGRRSP